MVIVGQTVAQDAKVLKARTGIGLGWTATLAEGFRLQRPFDGLSETFTQRESVRASKPEGVKSVVETRVSPSYEDVRK